MQTIPSVMQTVQSNRGAAAGIRPQAVAMSAPRVRKALLLAFSAFTTGSRLIPMGDNGGLLQALAAKSGSLPE